MYIIYITRLIVILFNHFEANDDGDEDECRPNENMFDSHLSIFWGNDNIRSLNIDSK